MSASTIVEIFKCYVLQINSYYDIAAVTNANLVTLRPSSSYLIFMEKMSILPGRKSQFLLDLVFYLKNGGNIMTNCSEIWNR